MISKPPKWQSYKDAPIKGNWFTRWLKSRFRIVDYPFLLAYRGFGNANQLVVQGHVFRAMALSRPRNRYSAWRNFISLVKMFLVRTVPNTKVSLELNGEEYFTTTNQQGFYEFQITEHNLPQDWHKVNVALVETLVEGQESVSVETEVKVIHSFEYGCISDIDDTFLVSHITKIWRKLYVLLTKNAETRKPFKGVVEFYNALENNPSHGKNPFFFVSSSEWNLYDFLINFMRLNRLPKGILQLKEIKDRWRDFFISGYGSHNHKADKIERIFALYPKKQFVLLGDNGQHDAEIYRNMVEKYPQQVLAVYIRAVNKKQVSNIQPFMDEIKKAGVLSLQFANSAEAQAHAVKNGIITRL